MTSITGHRPHAASSPSPELPKLAIGQRIEATVVGPNRRGVTVAIGQERFQLATAAKLESGVTLVLQGISPLSVRGQRVSIVASDGRPLPDPIPADLTTRPEPGSPSPGTIVTKGGISVVGQPLDAGGKVAGPSVTLHLEAAAPASDRQAPSKSAFAVGGTTVAAHAEGAARTGGRQAGYDHVQRWPSRDAGIDAGVTLGSVRGAGLQPSQTTSAGGRAPMGDRMPPGPHPAPTFSGFAQPLEIESPIAGPHAKAATALTAYGNVGSPARNASPETLRSFTSDPLAAVGRTTSATLVEKTATGGSVLKAGDQYFLVERPLDLPLGASLQIAVLQSMSALGPAARLNAFEDEETRLGKLVQILDAIDRAGWQTGEPEQPGSTRRLPSPDRHLASRLLSLLSMNDGELPPLERPQSASEQTASATIRSDRAQALFRDFAAVASETLADGWKSTMLPFGSDPTHALSCFFREQSFDPEREAEGDRNSAQETQRAVFDISFSELGRCQIDALCQERRFDLLVRSERALSDRDRQHIATLFSSACDLSGLHGEIGFKIGGFLEPTRQPELGNDLRT